MTLMKRDRIRIKAKTGQEYCSVVQDIEKGMLILSEPEL